MELRDVIVLKDVYGYGSHGELKGGRHQKVNQLLLFDHTFIRYGYILQKSIVHYFVSYLNPEVGYDIEVIPASKIERIDYGKWRDKSIKR